MNAQFVVAFEVRPRPERWDDYLRTAALLRPELERVDGFVDNERFRSRRTEGRLLSLSTWRDEKAVVRWRTHGVHHLAGQTRGRQEIFADYALRVGEVTADSGLPPGAEPRQQRFDETAVGAARALSIAELDGEPPDAGLPAGEQVVDVELYEGLNPPHRVLLLVAWRTAAAAAAWRPRASRLRTVRVIRDYGMRERREAPQFFPEVPT